jgi:uncharacterized protein
MQSANEDLVRFPSGAFSLEGRICVPDRATRAAVVCHPHPQYGGDMDNSVVVATTRALAEQDVATMRFNFRGVGDSEGSYSGNLAETDDARAAVACLRARLPEAKIALGGYSFGAAVALLGGHADSDVESLFAIALPATMFDLGAIRASAKAKLFLLGDRDPYCPYAALESVVKGLAGENSLIRLCGADHFLFGFEQEIGEAVARFVAG